MTKKNDQEVLVYKLCPDQYKQIIDEIHRSRELNTEEHDNIKKLAGDSATLANQMQALVDKWTNFWSVIMMLRNITFTIGFVIAMAYFITTLSEKAGWM